MAQDSRSSLVCYVALRRRDLVSPLGLEYGTQSHGHSARDGWCDHVDDGEARSLGAVHQERAGCYAGENPRKRKGAQSGSVACRFVLRPAVVFALKH